MADEPITPAAPQAGDPPAAPSPQAGNTTSPEPQAGDGQEPISLAEAKKLRSEAANLRERLKAADAKAKELDDLKAQLEAANLSDKEKLERKLAKLQSDHEQATRQLQERTIQYEVRLQAAQAGVNPKHLDKVTRLIDWAALEYDDDGQPTNVKALIDALLEDMPELKTPTAPAPTGGQPPKPPTPALPAMNPGRAAITPPTGNAGPFVRPSISDAYAQAAQQRRGQ